jgi:hypothetical protein
MSALHDLALRGWTALLNTAMDLALGASRAVVLNAGEPPADCAAVDVVADLRRCLTKAVSAHASADRHNLDYVGVRADAPFLTHVRRVRCLQSFDPCELGSDPERRAFWINLFSARTIDGVVRAGSGSGLRQRAAAARRFAYLVGGHPLTPDDIEHGILRGNRGHLALPAPQFAPGDARLAWVLRPDPRVHLALNCAARSCPPISTYDPLRLDAQLDQAAFAFVNGGGAEYDPTSNALALSRIFRWYRMDFGGVPGVLQFVRRYADASLSAAFRGEPPRVRWQPYDWSRNG